MPEVPARAVSKEQISILSDLWKKESDCEYHIVVDIRQFASSGDQITGEKRTGAVKRSLSRCADIDNVAGVVVDE